MKNAVIYPSSPFLSLQLCHFALCSAVSVYGKLKDIHLEGIHYHESCDPMRSEMLCLSWLSLERGRCGRCIPDLCRQHVFIWWRLRDPKLDIRIGTTKAWICIVKPISYISVPNGGENIFQLGRVVARSALSPMFGTTQIALQMPLPSCWYGRSSRNSYVCSGDHYNGGGRCVGAGGFWAGKEYYAEENDEADLFINRITLSGGDRHHALLLYGCSMEFGKLYKALGSCSGWSPQWLCYLFIASGFCAKCNAVRLIWCKISIIVIKPILFYFPYWF